MFKLKYTFLASVALLITWINLASIINPIIGCICLFVFFISTGKLLGSKSLIVGILSSLSLTMILGSIVYYFGTISQLSLGIILILVLLISEIISHKSELRDQNLEIRTLKDKKIPIIAITIILMLVATWWFNILPIEIVDSVRTPWDLVNPFLISVIGISVSILSLIIGNLYHKSGIALFILIFGSITLMAAIIYPLGYGFDPFIHQATVQHIAEFGTITPKPFYYIGQYVLELISHLIFAIPISIIDISLVPVLASLLIPSSAAYVIQKLGTNWKMMLFAILLLPIGAFISTTPQSLAYILTICLVLLSLPKLLNKASTPGIFFFGTLTLAILITHPMAGIPAAIYFALIFINSIKIELKIKSWITGTITALGAFSLPIIFILQSLNSNLDIQFSLSYISLNQLQISRFLSNHFNTWLDLLYLIIDNHFWIVIIFAGIGLYFAKKENLSKSIRLPLYAAIACLASYLILSLTLQFEFLIEYERSNYADRLIALTIIFLLPYVGIAFSSIWARIQNKSQSLKLGYAIGIGLIAIAMTYGAYPRDDNYARSAGFNVAQSDFDTIYAIDDFAAEQDYIVLANQAVSSAALEAFGFKKYYNNDIFYYPIPTGGQLYNYYLQMADENPSYETIKKAMNFTGVDLGFFVINEYWWDSDRIIEQAKLEADDWFSIEDGKVTIFIFETR